METEQDILTQMETMKNQYNALKNKLQGLKQNKLKEKFGKDFSCDNCRYDCARYYDGMGDSCVIYGALYPCEKFARDNKLSLFIKKLYSDKFNAFSAIEAITNLLNVNDFDLFNLDDNSKTVEKAIKILEVANS